ncbi:hypothetical protein NBRC111894_3739 [Sporolactobacillus inulinus]|uniref:Uncharacterized protein n=1 Tax=Sporolactobacillus inulinus TaxID=2078 RepID=A0A4Y1ZGG1_9BACL|nr:hypothetical protein NBRC111894_3739 [Sporolactobacillus inulinus]
MPVNPSDPSFTLFGDSMRTVTEQRDANNYIFQLFGPQLRQSIPVFQRPHDARNHYSAALAHQCF